MIKVNFSKAFTLIELLVSTAIVSILVALSVANYQEFRGVVNEAKALNTVRNLILGETAYYGDTGSYVACMGRVACTAILPGFKENDSNIGIQVAAIAGLGSSVLAQACHLRGRIRTSKGAETRALYIYMLLGGTDTTTSSIEISKTNHELESCRAML